ncbi:zinc finger BED domain-containing protein 1-like [Aphis craccivora]|uniref:Zinc finger BED domain-containing protein 1-like n=1 Tax=Aphis craccivora TaxID=307492 RepID=A0A6G0YED3_APHCR|nr:zinc finger BED domain-containing protein 1-like [Aphis craccivora]
MDSINKLQRKLVLIKMLQYQSKTFPSENIWNSFDKRVSSFVGQTNSIIVILVEMDKYLNECLLSHHMDPLK